MEDEQLLPKPEDLDEIGRRRFVNLAPLNPGSALASLGRALNLEQAASFVQKQRGSLAMWSTLLRHLAYQPENFNAAATMLLTLAELDTSNFVNCRDGWAEPFRIGLSGTMAPPSQRMELLSDLLTSTSGRRRELVWDAVEATLEASYINSSHTFSFGARPQGYGWEPANDLETVDWYEQAFKLLTKMAQSCPEGRERASTALARHFRDLWHTGLHRQLGDLTRDLTAKAGWSAGWLAVRSTLRFDAANMQPEPLAALKRLESELVPKGLMHEIRAYALSHQSGYLDIADSLDESDEEEDNNPLDAWQRVDNRVIELGEALSKQDASLQELLPELLADTDGRQVRLGQGLGRGSADPLRHWALLREAFASAEGEPRIDVLAGFAEAVKTSNPAAHVAILGDVVDDTRLDAYYPAFLGAPRDDADGDMLIAAMQRGVAKPFRFVIRTQERESGGLSYVKFHEALVALCSMDGGVEAAINQLYTECRLLRPSPENIPPDFADTARVLLQRFNFDSNNHNVAYRVNELAQLAFSGAAGAEAASAFSARFSEALDDYRTHGDDYGELACLLFKLQPLAALDAFLSKPKRKHFGFRARFVARHGSVVQCAPEAVILDWVRIAPEVRAPLVASEISVVSKAKDPATLSPLASTLLEMVADKVPVLEGFGRNFHPSHWSGSLPQTLEPYLAVAEQLTTHPDAVVSSWAKATLTAMRERIERERTMEVRQEQSFE